MAPNNNSKKGKASGGSSTSKKSKKDGSKLDGQKASKGASRKKWGKDRGKTKGDQDGDSGGGTRGLKPVRIKLGKDGQDAILDILHRLHVAGAGDGAGDDASEYDSDDGSDYDEEEGEEEEVGTDSDDREEESEDGSEAELDVDDLAPRQGQGDFEYNGSFGQMANLMSGLVVNESTVPTNGEHDKDSAASLAGKKGSPTNKAGKSSGVPEGKSASGRGGSSSNSSSPAVTTGKTRPQESPKNVLLQGGASGSAKGALRSTVTREKLLASMVDEDRKAARDEKYGKGGVPSAAIAAASTVGGAPVGADRGYRRPDPPAARKGNNKVRLVVCGEHKKTGAPDFNGKKIMVFDRSEAIQKVLETCRNKLHIKKKVKGAALLDGEEVVDWLPDLSWVTNEAVVLISCNGPKVSAKRGAPPGPHPCSSASTSAPAEDGSPSANAVGDDFAHAAPGSEGQEEQEEEVLALAALERIRESYRARRKGRESEARRRREGVPEEDAGKRMVERKRGMENTAPFRQMMAQRKSLPAYLQREDIVEAIRDNQVVVLSGETGCGKTTQVPQFVLDSLIDQGRGGQCNIVCTQPRRISAVGVAERVASERCERVGDTVGYQIRLESRVGPATRLTFCTTGILLRRLTSDDTLAGVSHVMVDEVHERDLQTDFLLVILRDLLPKRPDLRVVLMSATLQADLFTKYFKNCPAITIPGRTFPVEVAHMDTINRLVRGSNTPAVMPRVSSGPESGAGRGNGRATGGPQAGGAPSAASRGGSGRGSGVGRGQRQDEGDDDAMSVKYDALTGEPLEAGVDGGKQKDGAVDAAVTAMVSPKCEEKVDYEIMVDLVDYIMATEAGETPGSRGGGGGQGSSRNRSSKERAWRGGDSGGGGGGRGRGGSTASGDGANGELLGAILVFLPGFAEIDQLVKALERHPRIGRGSRVFPLHSSLPSHQQKSIFQRMPPGVRKIVVSTNIAETSVTIEDCTHVIDAGRVREMRYDPVTRMSCLVEVWISKASGSQRTGRAGRVRPGKCWRLYPEAFHADFMPPHTLAEMLRTPLEEMVLQVLLLELGSPADFLGRAVEPPPPKMLRAALRNLYDLQAIVIAKNTPILTPLGYHLAQLPMDARVGKLLLVAAILQCLDPILTIAAALSDKAPFQRPFGEQARADAARQSFAQHKSDHLAIVEAFGAWRNKRRTGSYGEVRRWCRDNFLSHPTLERLDGLREQFRQQLADAGFAASPVPSHRASGRDAAAIGSGNSLGGRGGLRGEGAKEAWQKDGKPEPQDPDRNSGNIALVQSVLCAGLYPHVAAFVRPDSLRQIKKAHFVTRDDLEPVFLHPSSVNQRRFAQAAASGRQVWVMYHSKMKTKQVYLHDSTYASAFSLLLWGARVRHERPVHSKKRVVDVVVDRWLRFRMDEKTAVAFKAMRRELSNLLVSKIEAPFADTGPLSGMLVACLERLLDIETRS